MRPTNNPIYNKYLKNSYRLILKYDTDAECLYHLISNKRGLGPCFKKYLPISRHANVLKHFTLCKLLGGFLRHWTGKLEELLIQMINFHFLH